MQRRIRNLAWLGVLSLVVGACGSSSVLQPAKTSQPEQPSPTQAPPPTRTPVPKFGSPRVTTVTLSPQDGDPMEQIRTHLQLAAGLGQQPFVELTAMW